MFEAILLALSRLEVCLLLVPLVADVAGRRFGLEPAVTSFTAYLVSTQLARLVIRL